ncbi:MAG: phospholipase A2, partial [Chloroflexota bacterium]
MLRWIVWPLTLLLGAMLTAAGAAEPTPDREPAHVGDEVCVSAVVEGAVGEVCARRERFGANWAVALTDTEDDDRSVRATVRLDVGDAPDESEAVENDDGVGRSVRAGGRFSPRVGTSLGDITVETCAVGRLVPDRCQTASAPLPQLRSRATPAQRERLEELVFEMPLEQFEEVRRTDERAAVDAGFDWTSDGCSAGPLRGLFDQRLGAACLRHDFAYRNFGQSFLDPTDQVRLRIEDQLAADAMAVGQGRLADGLRESLRRFGGPVFFGDDL